MTAFGYAYLGFNDLSESYENRNSKKKITCMERYCLQALESSTCSTKMILAAGLFWVQNMVKLRPDFRKCMYIRQYNILPNVHALSKVWS